MTLFVSPASGGSPIVNVSGTNMDFSIDITDNTANITALGYLVDVTLDDDIANIRWYQLPATGTAEYWTTWVSTQNSRVTGVAWSVGSYVGGCGLFSTTGSGVTYSPVAQPSLDIWYPNRYYDPATKAYKYFMGYTLNCGATGNYSLYTDKFYFGITMPQALISIDIDVTATLSFAGEESISSDSFVGNMTQYVLTEHDGFSVPTVFLTSGTHYTFTALFDVTINSLSSSPPSTIYFISYWFFDRDNFPPSTTGYRITGTSG